MDALFDMDAFGVLGILEHIGIFAFAMSGTVTAIEKRMDLFGIYVLSFITAMGGGVLRDVVLGVGVPAFFSSYSAIYNILIATTLAILLKGSIGKGGLIILCDAVGLAAFVSDAGVKAITTGANLPLFLFTSVITGVGGGVLRDIMCQRVPLILRKEVYASAGIVGALVLWFSYPVVGGDVARLLSLGLIFSIRMASVRARAGLPVVQAGRSMSPYVAQESKSEDTTGAAVDKENHL